MSSDSTKRDELLRGLMEDALDSMPADSKDRVRARVVGRTALATSPRPVRRLVFVALAAALMLAVTTSFAVANASQGSILFPLKQAVLALGIHAPDSAVDLGPALEPALPPTPAQLSPRTLPNESSSAPSARSFGPSRDDAGPEKAEKAPAPEASPKASRNPTASQAPRGPSNNRGNTGEKKSKSGQEENPGKGKNP